MFVLIRMRGYYYISAACLTDKNDAVVVWLNSANGSTWFSFDRKHHCPGARMHYIQFSSQYHIIQLCIWVHHSNPRMQKPHKALRWEAMIIIISIQCTYLCICFYDDTPNFRAYRGWPAVRCHCPQIQLKWSHTSWMIGCRKIQSRRSYLDPCRSAPVWDKILLNSICDRMERPMNIPRMCGQSDGHCYITSASMSWRTYKTRLCMMTFTYDFELTREWFMIYRWLSARLQYHQRVSNGNTTALH